MLARVQAMACVCLSQVGVLSKKMNGLIWFFFHGGFFRPVLHCVLRKYWQGYFPLQLFPKLWTSGKNNSGAAGGPQRLMNPRVLPDLYGHHWYCYPRCVTRVIHALLSVLYHYKYQCTMHISQKCSRSFNKQKSA